MRKFIGCDPFARISHPYRDSIVHMFCVDNYESSWWGMADGVLHEVQDHLRHAIRIRKHERKAGGWLNDDLNATIFPGERCNSVPNLMHDLRYIVRLAIQGQ